MSGRRPASSTSIRSASRSAPRPASTSRNRSRCWRSSAPAIPPLDQQVRQNIATLAVLLGEPPARLSVRGGSLSAIAPQRVCARPAVRPAAAASGYPRGRGAALGRQRQCGKRARRAVPEHLAHRPGRIRQHRAQHADHPAVGDLLGRRERDPAGVRRLPPAQRRSICRRRRRTELLQLYRKAIISGFGDVERALIAVRDLAEQERLQAEAVATARRAYELVRDAAARRHDRHHHRAEHAAHAVRRAGSARAWSA